MSTYTRKKKGTTSQSQSKREDGAIEVKCVTGDRGVVQAEKGPPANGGARTGSLREK